MLQIIEVIGKDNTKYTLELRTKNVETHSLLDDYPSFIKDIIYQLTINLNQAVKLRDNETE